MSSDINQTLEERGQRYGAFSGHAEITQNLKDCMKETGNWARLSASQRESLEMIAHKIGRILNGDPNYADSWVDIAGYSTLVVEQLNSTVTIGGVSIVYCPICGGAGRVDGGKLCKACDGRGSLGGEA